MAPPCPSGMRFHSVKMSPLRLRSEISPGTGDFQNLATRKGGWGHRGLLPGNMCIYIYILFLENIRKTCSDLKSGFWKGFETKIEIARQLYI